MSTALSLLVKSGEALYGPRFQSELARDLGVADRTMRRWIAGDTAIPAGVYADLRRLIKERRLLLSQVDKAISEAQREQDS